MKKVLILSIIISYSLGILSYKYQLPPYKQIKFAYKKIFSKNKNLNFEENILEEYNMKRKKYLSNHKISQEIYLIKYEPKMNIWIDRGYYNQINNNIINNFYLLKIERHYKKDIIIKSKKKINIIRPLCMLNDNSIYKDWTKLSYNLLIIGLTCIHDRVVSKEFQPGEIILPSGGPVASDPIFIEGLQDINEVKINFKN